MNLKHQKVKIAGKELAVSLQQLLSSQQLGSYLLRQLTKQELERCSHESLWKPLHIKEKKRNKKAVC